jgi:hypothetical protein
MCDGENGVPDDRPAERDEHDSLMETRDILSDAEAMVEIRQADSDIAAGRVSTLDEAMAEMRARGRLRE